MKHQHSGVCGSIDPEYKVRFWSHDLATVQQMSFESKLLIEGLIGLVRLEDFDMIFLELKSIIERCDTMYVTYNMSLFPFII